MKKILVVVLVVVTALSFAACGQPTMSDAQLVALAEDILEDQGKVIISKDELDNLTQLAENATESTEDVSQTPTEGSALENTEKPVNQTPAPKSGIFNADEVISQLETKDYAFHSEYLDMAYIVVKNNSEYVLKIEVTALFYDDGGNLIGTNTQDEYAFEPGYEMAFGFYNEEDFSNTEYEFWVEEENWYTPVLSSLSYESSVTDKKAIITVTNNGDVPAEFVEFIVLFLRGDELVYADSGYCIDGDNEIKPGKTQRGEAQAYEKFDSILVYLSGRADN